MYVGGIMSKVLSVSAARANLARLLEEVAGGEEIVLTRSGRPLARIVPLSAPASRARGVWRDQGRLGDDFDAPLPDDVLGAFEGPVG
jgi:prevent-host-death family protein